MSNIGNHLSLKTQQAVSMRATVVATRAHSTLHACNYVYVEYYPLIATGEPSYVAC